MNDTNKLYPFDPEFEYTTELVRINLDEEKKDDLKRNKGFIIGPHKGIKKDLKDIDGIFSTRFGRTLQDINPFADRYKCECGETMGRIHHNVICPHCNTTVKFIDDDFEYFGWIELKEDYHIIHPNLFKTLAFFIGEKRLMNIITAIDEKDQDGFTVEVEKPKDEPFFGLGMLDFKNKIDDVLDYYVKVNPGKSDVYKDLLIEKEKIFIHSIPVFTTQLRPYKVEEDKFLYGDTNEIYTLMSKLATTINSDQLRIYRHKKSKNKLLLDLQLQYNKLYEEVEKILEGKKGNIRSLFGGRYNFSSRAVIVPDPKLEVDQVGLSYTALTELLQQSIINILVKSHNMSYNDAYKIWYKASLVKDPKVYNIIQGIINNTEFGIPIIINRNPKKYSCT